MGRREDNQNQKRARIIAAAKVLFSKNGYEATTTRSIARRARIAHGTLFLYAKTRADVVAMVFHAEIGDAVRAAMATQPQGSFTDLCLHFYGAFIDVYARDPRLAAVIVKEMPWLVGESRLAMMGLTHEVLVALANHIAILQQQGAVRDDVVGMTTSVTSFAIYYGALTAWLGGELGDPSNDGRAAAVALLREGLLLLERGMTP